MCCQHVGFVASQIVGKNLCIALIRKIKACWGIYYMNTKNVVKSLLNFLKDYKDLSFARISLVLLLLTFN